MIHLQFRPTADAEEANIDPEITVRASGCTVLQALANLEAAVQSRFSEEARFSETSGFGRDLDLDEIADAADGTTFDFYDFSCPEDRFEITRLPDTDS